MIHCPNCSHEFQDPDEVPEEVGTKVAPGDIFQLGRHRLFCGDSTNFKNLDKLMGSQKPNLVYTDPPYGLGYVGDFYQDSVSKKATEFQRETNSFPQLTGDTGNWDWDPSPILDYFKDTKEIFLWGADYYSGYLPKFGSWVVWNKISEHQKMDNMPGASFELCWSKSKHKRHLFNLTWRGCFGHNRITDGAKKVHPTQKPVKLAELFFKKWGGGLVVDLFGGSGSTLISCERTDNRCFMMEIEPNYCSVIIARWEKFTGKKAELVSSA